jgi:hypothetical protein
MNLVAIGTLLLPRFHLLFFPKRAAKIGVNALRFQIFLLKLNAATLKAATGAGLKPKIF